jgi:hypothetical protein
VYVSTDNGGTWNVVNSGIPSSVHTVYALVLKGTSLFLATDDGIYKNTVGANSWTAVNTGLTNMIIRSLQVQGSSIYAGTQGGGAFVTTNDGVKWNEINNGLPLFVNVNCFASNGTTVFAGTDNGVFALNAGDTTWINNNTGLKDSSITKLTVSLNYLYAGTTSLGVWRRALSEFIITAVNEMKENTSFSVYPNPAKDEVFIVSSTESQFKDRSISLYNLYGQLIQRQAWHGNITSLDISGLPKGTYILKIEDDKNDLVSKIVKE